MEHSHLAIVRQTKIPKLQNDRRNIPPHARKVDVKLVVMTSSDSCEFLAYLFATSSSLPVETAQVF